MDPIVARSQEIIDQGSKSFAMAARLFAPSVRESAFMLYAWCRYCDDVIDGQDLGMNGQKVAPDEAARRFEALWTRTESALAGRADSIEFEALSRVVDRHAIPHTFAFDLLEGFRMDVSEHQYNTDADLLRYCYHVAGAVGVMMAYVLGVDDKPTLRHANDLGMAFQLTNIARDIVPDAEQSRLYLPARWLQAEGIPAQADAVARPEHRAGLGRLAERLIREADRYYDSAVTGIARLPWRSAWAIGTARDVYREIGYQITKAGGHAWDRRISVSTPRKIGAVFIGFGTMAATRFAQRADTDTIRAGLWTPPALDDQTR